MLAVTQIDTFYNGLTLRHRDTINAVAGGTFMKRRPKECYDLIENMTAHHNDWDTSAQRSESSSSITSSFDTEIVALKAEMTKINKNLMRVLHVNQQVKAITPNCETCGGPHSFNDCPATIGNTQNVYAVGAYQGIKETIILKGTTRDETNSSKELTKVNDAILKNMQTNMTSLKHSNLELKNKFGQFMKMNTASSSGLGTLTGPTIPTTSSSPVVECETEAKKDTVHPTNNGSTEDVQPPVVPTESSILNSEPVIYPIIEPVASLFGPSIKSLLTNKDKICELAKTLLNEHCSVVLLKKLLEKLGDPGNFLIPCDFPRMAECLALADLGASINLMPLSVWNKVSLPNLSTTCMTLELADRSISPPVGVSKDVFVKVGTFHFSAEFVVVDFDADPRVPLILERSFLKIGKDLIDVFEGELTLRVGKEAITFNLDQTSRYSANYNDIMANRIDVIDMACEDDFLLKEVDAFLALKDDPTLPKVDQSYVDIEGDILLLENFLNDDPSLPTPNQGNYLPEIRKELKICEAKTNKSSIDEPPEVELKDLPPHLEYIFLEGDDKLPVIIMKDFSMEGKTALITVLKSRKRGIAWKLSDIKGFDRDFYTHKILMEEDFEPAGGFTTVENEENELILTRLVTGWRVCINYHKLNEATRKDHFPLPFMDQMLERLVGNQYYCFLDVFSGYFQIPIDPKDQEKTTFTCPYGTFAYRRMPFGLCNAPGTFQRDMPFELMCDASDFDIGAVLGQRQEEHFRPIHYASKTMTEAESNYITTEKEMLAVVGNKYILVAFDYLSKWVEAKALLINDARVVCKFLKNLFARFGTPEPLSVIEERTFAMTSKNHASWSDKLDDALLAFRTAYKTPIGCTPYKLVYGKACHLLIELEQKAYWALKHANFDLQTTGDHRKVISIFTVSTYVSLGCSGNTTWIMHRTLDISLTFHTGSITEFVYLVEAHHHLNPIFIPKDNIPRRLDDGVVMLVLEAHGHPLRFGEAHLSLVALNPKLEVFYALSYNQLSGPLVDGRSENFLSLGERWFK
uniref:DNA-directed DNA polymerase n=1 Tax=Tanacetum cinerariifolium TaxID=118510 RepID=A0A6L2LGR1_TANCI|nr:DNA-directed DNA polymerase [Tanacetum cinerariifolium]